MARLIKKAENTVLAEKLIIANTFLDRIKGLMGAPRLSDSTAMWILPCKSGIHSFFMKFPIDVLFVDASLCICYLKYNLKPWRVIYPPLFSKPHSVFEFPHPTLHKMELKPGDKLQVI